MCLVADSFFFEDREMVIFCCCSLLFLILTCLLFFNSHLDLFGPIFQVQILAVSWFSKLESSGLCPLVLPISPLQGSAFTAIEPEPDVNALCYFPETGLLLLATNDTKMLAYYIPVSHQATTPPCTSLVSSPCPGWARD